MFLSQASHSNILECYIFLVYMYIWFNFLQSLGTLDIVFKYVNFSQNLQIIVSADILFQTWCAKIKREKKRWFHGDYMYNIIKTWLVAVIFDHPVLIVSIVTLFWLNFVTLIHIKNIIIVFKIVEKRSTLKSSMPLNWGTTAANFKHFILLVCEIHVLIFELSAALFCLFVCLYSMIIFHVINIKYHIIYIRE